MEFHELGLRPELLEAIDRLGFAAPTPVQAEVIPKLLKSQQDLVALAQTGTGKTAAFGLPLLELLEADVSAPQALVLCPTRELCMQITRDLQSFARGLGKVKVLAVYGGADIRSQLSALRRGVQIVVATPGRMLDILGRQAADFTHVRRVVLDEADEMLNMGFEEDLEAILATVPEGAQTLLFSATMPPGVEKIARKYMTDAAEITVGTRNAGADNVSHEYYVVHAKNRYQALRRIVDVYPGMYGIVFCRTRVETQEVADWLSRDGYNAQPLHGDLSQQQRDNVMRKFRERQLHLLVATDVAARGLDVDNLTHVINYNLPDELNAYTHRSGRTGRAGKEGISVSIVHLRERFKIRRLEQVIGKGFQQQQVPTGEQINRARLVHAATQIRDEAGVADLLDRHLPELSTILEELPKEEVIKRFLSLSLGPMLEFYRNAPDLNADARREERGKGKGKGKVRREDGPGKRGPDAAGEMISLVMNAGELNGLTPQKLMALVNVADRKTRVTFGRINIVRKQAWFEVPEEQAQGVIESFSRRRLDHNGRPVVVSRSDAPRPEKPARKFHKKGGPAGAGKPPSWVPPKKGVKSKKKKKKKGGTGPEEN